MSRARVLRMAFGRLTPNADPNRAVGEVWRRSAAAKAGPRRWLLVGFTLAQLVGALGCASSEPDEKRKTALTATVPLVYPATTRLENVTYAERVRVYDSRNGQLLAEAQRSSDNREWLIPTFEQPYSVRTDGSGYNQTGIACDTVMLDFEPARDRLLRLADCDTSVSWFSAAGTTRLDDHASLIGFVYGTSPGGVRRDVPLECATVYLDGARELQPDQAYVDCDFVAQPRSTLARTPRAGGFAFANLTPGEHTVRVSLDDGQTFVAEKTFFAPLSRADSSFIYRPVDGPEYRELVYILNIDVESSEGVVARCEEALR